MIDVTLFQIGAAMGFDCLTLPSPTNNLRFSASSLNNLPFELHKKIFDELGLKDQISLAQVSRSCRTKSLPHLELTSPALVLHVPRHRGLECLFDPRLDSDEMTTRRLLQHNWLMCDHSFEECQNGLPSPRQSLKKALILWNLALDDEGLRPIAWMHRARLPSAAIRATLSVASNFSKFLVDPTPYASRLFLGCEARFPFGGNFDYLSKEDLRLIKYEEKKLQLSPRLVFHLENMGLLDDFDERSGFKQMSSLNGLIKFLKKPSFIKLDHALLDGYFGDYSYFFNIDPKQPASVLSNFNFPFSDYRDSQGSPFIDFIYNALPLFLNSRHDFLQPIAWISDRAPGYFFLKQKLMTRKSPLVAKMAYAIDNEQSNQSSLSDVALSKVTQLLNIPWYEKSGDAAECLIHFSFSEDCNITNRRNWQQFFDVIVRNIGTNNEKRIDYLANVIFREKISRHSYSQDLWNLDGFTGDALRKFDEHFCVTFSAEPLFFSRQLFLKIFAKLGDNSWLLHREGFSKMLHCNDVLTSLLRDDRGEYFEELTNLLVAASSRALVKKFLKFPEQEAFNLKKFGSPDKEMDETRGFRYIATGSILREASGIRDEGVLADMSLRMINQGQGKTSCSAPFYKLIFFQFAGWPMHLVRDLAYHLSPQQQTTLKPSWTKFDMFMSQYDQGLNWSSQQSSGSKRKRRRLV